MIWLYTGTPGSGKSLHATADILDKLRTVDRKGRGYVIANYPLRTDSERFLYRDNSDLTPRFLAQWAYDHHKVGVEGQSLLVIDEAAVLFNCRDFARKDRADWVLFFQVHRKLGYNVILITQQDRMLDKQIRGFAEYEVRHRKLNNAGGFGVIFNILHIPLFVKIETWYGSKSVLNKSFFAITSASVKPMTPMRCSVRSVWRLVSPSSVGQGPHNRRAGHRSASA